MHGIFAIVAYVSGIAACSVIYWLLRRRLSEAAANGLGVLALLIAQYPLMVWHTDGPHIDFTMWLVWCTLGALAATGLNSLLRSKGQ